MILTRSSKRLLQPTTQNHIKVNILCNSIRYHRFSTSSALLNARMNTIVNFVPQQEAWVVERFGRFNRILEPGLNILLPLIDKIRYAKSLKEVAIEIPAQTAITEDNVTLNIDGVLYFKVVDPYKASYGIEDHEYAVSQLAQTTMRAEIGRLTLDRTLADRALLNHNIVNSINTAASEWGIVCLRYEIRDIHPPEKVVKAMHSQVSADRQKRADILASEGTRQAAINVAEGQKQATILAAEAQKEQEINRASGEAEAIRLRARATAQALEEVARAISNNSESEKAISLKIAEQYLMAFGGIAKEGTTILMDSKIGEPSDMIVKAMSVFQKLNSSNAASLTPDKNQSSVSQQSPTSQFPIPK